MNFAKRITAIPRPFDAQRGQDARALFGDMPPEVADLIDGAAGSSPYLAGLVAKEADWLRSSMDMPEIGIDPLLADLMQDHPDPMDKRLRQAKRRVALLTALADLGGAWSLEEVTGALTRFADVAVSRALQDGIKAEVGRKRLPESYLDHAPFVVLAMGKMGAFELNYSSDIDLICLFDETQITPDELADLRPIFIRIIRHMTRVLSDITQDGYVFRTDLRLRPDAAVTPVILPMITAERYYESVGRTWERAAFIKARPAAGDIAAGTAFLDTLRPFVWRRHLDFAAIQDAHDMRLKIRAHKGLHGPITLSGHDMKLGRGGIREIEFFTQTRQLISGGRDTQLRVRGTVDGLTRLSHAGWIAPEVAEKLTDHYRAHRLIEHRLQMIGDQQTHALPGSDAGFDQLAALSGTDAATLKGDLRERLQDVHHLTESFFAPKTPAPVAGLSEFGQEVSARWPKYPALRSARASKIFDRLRPDILTRLQNSEHPDAALTAFDQFLSGLPAGVQLFSLFEANPQLIDLIADISATSVPLARYLSRNASVFDAVIGGSFFADWPGGDALRHELSMRLNKEPDYESQLDTARLWHKEWHFRIGVHLLRGIVTTQDAGRQYADLARAVLGALWPVTCQEFARKHGDAPGRGASVLAMGSLGAGHLNAGSDLDLIVIYDGQGAEASEGKRPLATSAYYARLTQAFITALTVQTAAGALYETDMRLRPSGRHGPVATAWSAFQSYQKNEAWTWEHLALTRAQPVAGAPDLAIDFEKFRQNLLSHRSKSTAETLSDVRDMRDKIAQAVGAPSVWNVKTTAGALQDIELLAQTAALLTASSERSAINQIKSCVAHDWLSVAQRADICAAYGLFRSVQDVLRLVEGTTPSEAALKLMARETGVEVAHLASHIEETATKVAKLIDHALESLPKRAHDERG